MKAHVAIPVDQWAACLQPTIDASHGLFTNLVVVSETDSTQSEAQRRDAAIGSVIVAGRQTAGRGRLGRTWADTGADGVAMTLVLPADRPERMAIATAVAVAGAVKAIGKLDNGLESPKIGIKWPNDIMACGRKLAGILIEQRSGRALVGIGINVAQTTWPEEIASRAVSLTELGFTADRIEVAGFVLQSMFGAWSMPDDLLIDRFRRLDVLQGSLATFRSAGIEHRGMVLRVDPMRGLAVRTAHGEVWLPAATTTVLHWHSDPSR